MRPPTLFFLKIYLAIWGILWFYINFRISCSSERNAIGVLIGIALILYIALGKGHFNNINPFSPRARCIFHLFTSSMYCSFLSTGPSLLWLNLFLHILCFLMQSKHIYIV